MKWLWAYGAVASPLLGFSLWAKALWTATLLQQDAAHQADMANLLNPGWTPGTLMPTDSATNFAAGMSTLGDLLFWPTLPGPLCLTVALSLWVFRLMTLTEAALPEVTLMRAVPP